MKPGVAAWLVLAVLAAAPAGARELWSRGDASLEFSGSLRELLVAHQRQIDHRIIVTTFAR